MSHCDWTEYLTVDSSKRSTAVLLRDAKQCCSCLEFFFVGEMQQKLAIWCLKCKSLNINLLFTVVLNQYHICNHVFLKKQCHSSCDFNSLTVFCLHILNFANLMQFIRLNHAVKEHTLNAHVHCLTRFITTNVSVYSVT